MPHFLRGRCLSVSQDRTLAPTYLSNIGGFEGGRRDEKHPSILLVKTGPRRLSILKNSNPGQAFSLYAHLKNVVKEQTHVIFLRQKKKSNPRLCHILASSIPFLGMLSSESELFLIISSGQGSFRAQQRPPLFFHYRNFPTFHLAMFMSTFIYLSL